MAKRNGHEVPARLDPERTADGRSRFGGGGSRMKNGIIAILVFAAGILLGIAVRPLSVRAQPTVTGNVYVDDVSGGSGKPVRGARIVGFSCAVDGSGSIHCYAASVNHR